MDVSLKQLFRRHNDPSRRILKKIQPLIHQINILEDPYKKLSDKDLAEKTSVFRTRLAQGETLDDLLVEAFATIREASARVLGMRHFDVQMQGGIVLHQGKIAEMKTGEGKTLVATAPLYLNALAGKGVHLVTVNDYLAQRDLKTMEPLYAFLGLSTGCIIQDLSNRQRKEAYHADITYGTNNEFGFDYLRDNMKFTRQDMCQRPFFYAIVDEVDSILIDEARTPLIISGASEDSSELYEKANAIIGHLTAEDYEKEERHKNVAFTNQGVEHVAQLCFDAGLIPTHSLYESQNVLLVHHLNQALKAHKLFQRDVDYIVKDGEVVIIDEFTGRMMKGRRYSDGLHQALEAKEHVNIEEENQTVASITFQNYFRMYPKLAGMTGTAMTEDVEFEDTYGLKVVAIPTNVPIARKDEDDEIFITFDQKLKSILQKVKECHAKKQPVLIGTVSIESSEIFSSALKAQGLKHNVLNARHHAQEAHIIAQAGMPGAITIATNMAGRGTDIKMGGNLDMRLRLALENVEDEQERMHITQEVTQDVLKKAQEAREAGGLFVIGTERHESRRIDDQLRGRSGRQGDPGGSKFYISLEDELMRNFSSSLSLMKSSLKGTGDSGDAPVSHPYLTNAIEKAQKSIEAQHYDSRKQILKYSDILNNQRIAIYDERNMIIDTQTPRALVLDLTAQTLDHLLSLHRQGDVSWDLNALAQSLSDIFALALTQDQWPSASLSMQDMRQWALGFIQAVLLKKEEQMPSSAMERLERNTLLRTLDQVWIDHLNAMERLRNGIHLQAYGQKDPLNEYKGQAFIMFKAMIQYWQQMSLAKIFHFDPMQESWLKNNEQDIENLSYEHTDLLSNQEDVEGDDENTPEDVLEPKFIEDFLKHLETLQNLKKVHQELKEKLEGLEKKEKPVLTQEKKTKSRAKPKKKDQSDEDPSQETPAFIKKAPVRRAKKVEEIAGQTSAQKSPKQPPQDQGVTQESEERVSGKENKIRKEKVPEPKLEPQKKPSQKKTKPEENSDPLSRTSLCPCGSGKRYKHCHGALG